MNRSLETAVKAKDIPQVRGILLDMISSKSQSTSSLKEIAAVIAKTPDLFDKDDGFLYGPSAKEMTLEQVEALRTDIKTNFSVKKFSRLVEVMEVERENPHYYKDRVKEVVETIDFPEGKMKLSEEIVDKDIITADAEPEYSKMDVQEEYPQAEEKLPLAEENVPPAEENVPPVEEGKKKTVSAVGRTFGYVVLLLGLAAAITGLCVPVKFLIGLGIGVLMLGAAIVYTAISCSQDE